MLGALVGILSQRKSRIPWPWVCYCPSPPAGPRLVNIINQTGGQGIAVSDPEIIEAQLELAREEGLFVEPSSAAALAGLKQSLERDIAFWPTATRSIARRHVGYQG